MKKLILFLTVMSVVITACRKKEINSPEPTIVIADDPNTFRGFMISTTWTNSISGIRQTGHGAEAHFHRTPVKGFGGANEVFLNHLSVNSRTLSNDNMMVYMLMNSADTVNLAVDTWSIVGNSGIPSFVFRNSNPFPVCADFNIIPDSISKTNGYSFDILNVSEITSGWFSIGDGVGVMLNYSLLPGSNHIEIKPAELQAMATGTAGSITLELEKRTVQAVSGKNFSFSKRSMLTKHVKIKP